MKWATWLYYPDEGKQLCLRHLNGRTWRGTDGEAEKTAKLRQMQPQAIKLATSLDQMKLNTWFEDKTES